MAVALAVAVIFTGVSSGIATWFFNDQSKATAVIEPDGSDQNNKVIIDDIAENYYFGSNIDADEYYDLYFFAQPQYSFYNSNLNYVGDAIQEYKSPVDYFNAEITSMTPPAHLI